MQALKTRQPRTKEELFVVNEDMDEIFSIWYDYPRPSVLGKGRKG